jgi:hypothetical protein
VLQISPRTVETQLFRAVKKIRQELERSFTSSSPSKDPSGNKGQTIQALLLLVLFQ